MNGLPSTRPGHLGPQERGRGFLPGEKVRYRCDKGYELERPVGGNALVCRVEKRRSAVWSPPSPSSSWPSCRRVDCGRPPLVDNGMVEVGDTRWNSTVFYLCDAGYRLLGNDRLHCSSRAQWISR